MLMASLGISIANVGLPAMAEAFGASFAEVQWIVLGYLLASTMLVVGIGRLGDIAGRRRLLLAGIALFTGASTMGSIAPTIGWLVAARALQGLGAAAMMGLSLALVGETVPKERTGSVMGLLGTMSATGTALGPTFGGVLVAVLGWQGLFLVSLPLGLLAFHLVHRHLPADRDGHGGLAGFDILGTALLGLSLGAYALAMTVGHGSFGPSNALLLAAALVGTGLFLRVEARATAPLLRLAMFRDPSLSAGLAMSLLVSTVMMTTLVVGPFQLSQGLGLAPVFVGMTMSAGPLVTALVGIPAGRLVDRFGASAISIPGLAAAATAAVALSVMPARFGVAGYVIPLIVMTAGYALFQAGNNTAVMRDVHGDQRGVVSGMLNLSRNLGLATGASVMGTVFALASGGKGDAAPRAEAALRGTHAAFGVAALLIMLALAIAIGSRHAVKRSAATVCQPD
jgi:MFS family permease